ncbi:MAG: glycerate kinase [Burkholderiaceae bacterium]
MADPKMKQSDSETDNSLPRRQLMRKMFDAAVGSAQPNLCVPTHLPSPDSLGNGRLVVIGAGKASAAMAHAVEQHWAGHLSGLVVTRYGYEVACSQIEIVQAAHPVPDAAGEQAARRLLSLAHGLGENDTVLCLISGGGSSLLPLAINGLTLEHKQQLNQSLLASGATITEMNVVRRHLSAIKGGRLAAASYPAKMLTLMISDVPGDNPIDIASGPTVGDPTSCQDALDIVRRYGIELAPEVLSVLESGQGESVKPGDPLLSKAEAQIIAAPQIALEAAATVAAEAGYTPFILGDSLEGEAREAGRVLGAIARQVARRQQPFPTPCAILSGGETTVTLRGTGRGGRNVELLLSMALALDGQERVHAMACDTDGVDGAEEIAGAVLTPDTLQRARAMGIRPADSLAQNDGHGFFSALNDSVVSGPTLTNVNDFRVILVDSPT